MLILPEIKAALEAAIEEKNKAEAFEWDDRGETKLTYEMLAEIDKYW